MGSLIKFRSSLLEAFPDIAVENEEIYNFVEKYIEDQQKEFKQNKGANKLSFGKYAGYSISELALTDKGKSYLEWLVGQSFFTPEKFPEYYDEIKRLKIKKKTRTPLE